MADKEMLFELCGHFVHAECSCNTLGEPAEAVKRLLLLVKARDDMVRCLADPRDISIRLIQRRGKRSIRLLFRRSQWSKPSEEGRRDSSLNKELDGRVRRYLRAVEKGELTQMSKGIDIVLHLVLHNFTRVVVPVQAKDAKFARLARK